MVVVGPAPGEVRRRERRTSVRAPSHHADMADEEEWVVEEWVDEEELEWREEEERLIAAARRGDAAEVRLLLDAGVDLRAENDEGRTLFVAATAAAREGGHFVEGEVVPMLLRELANEELLPRVDRILLLCSQVSEMVVDGADVNARHNNGFTALHMSAKMGLNEVAGGLLKRERIEVNATDDDGWTPLHWSAARGRVPRWVHSFLAQSSPALEVKMDHRAVVELLATHGGDVTAEDNEGWTPIHRAAALWRDWYKDPVEPDLGIINYLLRETGAIVPFAKSVVKAHYRRQREGGGRGGGGAREEGAAARGKRRSPEGGGGASGAAAATPRGFAGFARGFLK